MNAFFSIADFFSRIKKQKTKIHHRIFTVCKAIMEKNIEKSTANVVDNIFCCKLTQQVAI